jgi:hypothetical protein
MDFDVDDNAYRKNWFVMAIMTVWTGRMKTAAVTIYLSLLTKRSVLGFFLFLMSISSPIQLLSVSNSQTHRATCLRRYSPNLQLTSIQKEFQMPFGKRSFWYQYKPTIKFGCHSINLLLLSTKIFSKYKFCKFYLKTFRNNVWSHTGCRFTTAHIRPARCYYHTADQQNRRPYDHLPTNCL